MEAWATVEKNDLMAIVQDVLYSGSLLSRHSPAPQPDI